MKRVVLFTMILALAAMSLFAVENDNAKTTVKLDLDVEKFVIGFSNNIENARAFKDDTDEFIMTSSVSNSANKTEVVVSHDGNMYFFYDVAMKRNSNFKLTAEIVRPLTQQDGDKDATEPDKINYSAEIKNIGYTDSKTFQDGTWVTDTTVDLKLDSDSTTTDTSNTGTVMANLRGAAKAPYTVVYACAFQIQLDVLDGQHLEAKKSAVYKSEIKFTIENA